ncbi:Late embryogenesis abundant protein Lea14-A [Bienertia sinuspersici]
MSGFVDKAKNFVAEKIADIPKPEASIEDVDLKGVSKEGVSYNARVGVMNPYSHSIPISEVSYVLKSDGRVILSGNMPDPGSIRGNDTTMLDVLMKVPHSIIVSIVRDIFRDWDIDYELEIGLIVDLPIIGDFTIPLRSKGEIKLPSIKDFFRGGDDDDDKKE